MKERHQEYLKFVAEYVKKNGFPPSYSEIGTEFSFTRQAAQKIASKLQATGHLKRQLCQKRSIALTPKGRQEIKRCAKG